MRSVAQSNFTMDAIGLLSLLNSGNAPIQIISVDQFYITSLYPSTTTSKTLSHSGAAWAIIFITQLSGTSKPAAFSGQYFTVSSGTSDVTPAFYGMSHTTNVGYSDAMVSLMSATMTTSVLTISVKSESVTASGCVLFMQ